MSLTLWIVLAVAVTSATYVSSNQTDNTVNVETPQGKIKGVAVPVIGKENQTVYQFRKIPYAVPPLGHLRFAKPIPHPSWNTTLDATEFGAACMQPPSLFRKIDSPNKNISEDCLFLNIYIPNDFMTQTNLSVMVWIHGGGFVRGAGMWVDGSNLVLEGNVIVVTINYRLGIFGFFTSGNSLAKGNYGLWDQILALKWVNKNIASFGGNPNSVTIFGQSAGSFSASIQALFPNNKGLFHKVIFQGGGGTSFFGAANRGMELTHEIGIAATCTQEIQDPSFLKCMRNRSAKVLMSATLTVRFRPLDAINFLNELAPVVDFELLHDTPSNILRGPPSAALDFFKSLDIVVGNCNQAGSVMFYTFQNRFPFDLSFGIPFEIFFNNIVFNLTKVYFFSNVNVSAAICKSYCIQNNISQQALHALDMFTDLFFVAPSVENLNLHLKNNTRSKQYQYIFTRQSPEGYTFANPTWLRGSEHRTDNIYLFHIYILQNINITVHPEDFELSKKMVRYWTNFAKTGDPNGGRDPDLLHWPEYNAVNKSYLQLDWNIVTGQKYKESKTNLWLYEIPKLLKGTQVPNTLNHGLRMQYTFSIYCTAFIAFYSINN